MRRNKILGRTLNELERRSEAGFLMSRPIESLMLDIAVSDGLAPAALHKFLAGTVHADLAGLHFADLDSLFEHLLHHRREERHVETFRSSRLELHKTPIRRLLREHPSIGPVPLAQLRDKYLAVRCGDAEDALQDEHRREKLADLPDCVIVDLLR